MNYLQQSLISSLFLSLSTFCTAQLTIEPVAFTDACPGQCNATVTAEVTNGTPPYIIIMGDPNDVTFSDTCNMYSGNSAFFYGLCPDDFTTYYFTVTDANGFTAQSSFFTIYEAFIQAYSLTDYNGYDVSCFGLSDATAEATFYLNNPNNISFSWSNSVFDATNPNIPAGNYFVDLFYSTFEYDPFSMSLIPVNCTMTDFISITEPTQMTTTASVLSNYNGSDISCNGALDGSLSASSSGGVGGYSYVWDTDPSTTILSNASLISQVGAGDYQVTSTDDNGCNVVVGISLIEPDVITVSESVIDEISGNDGSVDITATGGTSPYTYSWTGPNSFTSSQEDINGLTGGTYYLTVTDANGCILSNSYLVESQLGITDDAFNNISIYPNPTKGDVFISSDNLINEYVLYDIAGKSVCNGIVNELAFNVPTSSLTPGVYYIRLQSNGTYHIAKINKQ